MAKMSKDERLSILRDLIEEHHTVSTSELQEVLDVSRMTLFRDLETLQGEGLIERLYGSVTLSRSLYDINESLGTNIEEKRRIAQKALSLIKDDDNVFLGPGTTVLEIAKAIVASETSLTVFTSSLPVANTINNPTNTRLIMSGGHYHPQTKSLTGPISRRSVEGLSGRIMFFGANGVDLHAGITSYFAEISELLRQMMQACKIKVVVADSTKFGKINMHRICAADEVDLIITDSGIDAFLAEEIQAAGIPLEIV